MVLTSNTASVSPTGSLCGSVKLRVFVCSATMGSNGPRLVHSYFPLRGFLHSLEMKPLSVTKIAPAIPYNHTYFLFPLPWGNKVAIAYTCWKHSWPTVNISM